MNAAKWAELELAAVVPAEVRIVPLQHMVVGVVEVGVAEVTLVSAPRQPVHSQRSTQVFENGHANSLSPQLIKKVLMLLCFSSC